MPKIVVISFGICERPYSRSLTGFCLASLWATHAASVPDSPLPAASNRSEFSDEKRVLALFPLAHPFASASSHPWPCRNAKSLPFSRHVKGVKITAVTQQATPCCIVYSPPPNPIPFCWRTFEGGEVFTIYPLDALFPATCAHTVVMGANESPNHVDDFPGNSRQMIFHLHGR